VWRPIQPRAVAHLPGDGPGAAPEYRSPVNRGWTDAVGGEFGVDGDELAGLPREVGATRKIGGQVGRYAG
jgi:hypothetical protein